MLFCNAYASSDWLIERQNLETEFNELTQRRQQLDLVVARDRSELLKALKKDLRSLKKKYGE